MLNWTVFIPIVLRYTAQLHIALTQNVRFRQRLHSLSAGIIRRWRSEHWLYNSINNSYKKMVIESDPISSDLLLILKITAQIIFSSADTPLVFFLFLWWCCSFSSYHHFGMHTCAAVVMLCWAADHTWKWVSRFHTCTLMIFLCFLLLWSNASLELLCVRLYSSPIWSWLI